MTGDAPFAAPGNPRMYWAGRMYAAPAPRAFAAPVPLPERASLPLPERAGTTPAGRALNPARSAPVRRTSARGFHRGPQAQEVMDGPAGVSPVAAARVGTRASVTAAAVGNRSRAGWAFPVLVSLVISLTWMDVGVLRAKNTTAAAVPAPLLATEGLTIGSPAHAAPADQPNQPLPERTGPTVGLPAANTLAALAALREQREAGASSRD